MSTNWWAEKIGGGQANGQSAPRYNPPRPAPGPIVNSPVENLPPVKAQSAKQTTTCPDCFSDNYMRATPNAALRCFDCGYPLVQSGSGMSNVKTEGPVRPARQPAGTANNYHPETIVGRIG